MPDLARALLPFGSGTDSGAGAAGVDPPGEPNSKPRKGQAAATMVIAKEKQVVTVGDAPRPRALRATGKHAPLLPDSVLVDLDSIPVPGTRDGESGLRTRRGMDAIDRWMRRSWASLALASVLSTAGLALAIAPLLRAQIESWPWAQTHLLLLAAVPVMLAALVFILTLRQSSLVSWRRKLDLSLQAQIESSDEKAAGMTRDVHELESQLEARRQVERTLQAVTETLRRELDDEKRETSQHEQHLNAVRRAAEIQNAHLRELNKMAHEFTSRVSHEFRTPLTVIREYATALNEELVGTITAEQRDYLATIVTRVDDLAVMVNDVVDLGSLETNILVPSRRRCDVLEVLRPSRAVLERKADACGVELVVDTESGLPAVYCDPQKVSRVIVNLGLNAIKFSEPGKAVTLWCRRHEHGDELVFGVTDQGPGVPPEHLERIFRSFEQLDTHTRSSTKGFGLGLTIVRELVHLNFGRVQVQSEVGKGSVFSFTIPLAAPERLLPLYMSRVMDARHPSHTVSLITVRAEPSSAEQALQEIEHYLTSQVRRTDLVLATQRDHWLVVAATDRAGVDHMLNRLTRGWSEMDPHSHGDLPALQWRIAGCFDESRRGDLIRTFVQLSSL